MKKEYLKQAATLIRDNKNLLEHREIEELFRLTVKYDIRGALGQLLYEGTNGTFLNFIDHLPNGAFYGAELPKIVLPDNVLSIGADSFAQCSAATIVTPKDILIMGQASFRNSSIKSLPPIKEYPSEVIPAETYYGCNNLEQVVIPDGVAQIGMGVFRDCANLKKITIPKTVIQFSSKCFADCPKLSLIEYEGTIKEWRDITKSPSYHDGCGTVLLNCFDMAVNLSSI